MEMKLWKCADEMDDMVICAGAKTTAKVYDNVARVAFVVLIKNGWEILV